MRGSHPQRCRDSGHKSPSLPAAKTWCILPLTALRRRVRVATGARWEGRAAPRRVSPGGEPTRAAPEGSVHPPLRAGCPMLLGCMPGRDDRVGHLRREEERTKRGCKTARGALSRRHKTKTRRCFPGAPLPPSWEGEHKCPHPEALRERGASKDEPRGRNRLFDHLGPRRPRVETVRLTERGAARACAREAA